MPHRKKFERDEDTDEEMEERSDRDTISPLILKDFEFKGDDDKIEDEDSGTNVQQVNKKKMAALKRVLEKLGIWREKLSSQEDYERKTSISCDSTKISSVKLKKPQETETSEMATLIEQDFNLSKKLTFFKEIENLSSKNHRNVIKIQKITFEERSNGDYTMKTLAYPELKETFSDWRKRSFRNIEEVRFVLSSALRGLQFLHMNKIVHLKINFQNLMLDEYGDCIISGLGQNQFEDLHKIATGKLSTQEKEFIAPEILDSYKTKRAILDCEDEPKTLMEKTDFFTTKSDIYSFGIILYRIFIDKSPEAPSFSKITQENIYANLKLSFKIQKNEVHENMVSELVEILKKTLSLNPNDRPDASLLLEKYQIFSKIQFMQKNLEETFRLGLQYDEGEGVVRNPNTAREHFENASKKGHFPSSYFLGCFLLLGLGGKYDKKNGLPQCNESAAKALEYFEHQSDLGDKHSQVALGIIYDSGNYVKKSYSLAFHYYILSSQQGHSGAIFSLGFLYEQGDGVVKDQLKAFELFKLAADKNDPCALHKMGALYDSGSKFTPKNVSIAFEYYTKAAALGNAASIVKIGLCHNLGIVVEKDLEKARQKYELAAAMNEPEANYQLGVLYEEGEGVKKNLKKAIAFFEKAAEQDHPESIHELGILWENEEELGIDLQKAADYYKRGSDLGQPESQFCLGTMYYMGQVVNQDFPKAVELLRSSAAKGVGEAQLMMANFHAEGIILKRSDEKSKYYLKLCAKYGDGDIKFNYAAVNIQGLDGSLQPNYDEAYSYLLQCQAEGVTEAAAKIEEILEDGKVEEEGFIFREMK